jgi:serine/threonine protein kinase
MMIGPPSRVIGPYVLHETVGVGRGGISRRATVSGSDFDYCLKVVSKEDFTSELIFRQFSKELTTMLRCSSPFVLGLLDLLDDPQNFYVVTELCHGGDLSHYIQKRRYLSDVEGLELFREVLEGVAALHRLGFAHRDLKPENIFLDGGHHAKVADLGFVADVADPIPFLTQCGTVGYAAPELIRKIECDPRKSDIWSLGVVLFQALTGRTPWARGVRGATLAGDVSVPSSVPPLCARVIREFLRVAPDERPDLERVLAEDWLETGPPRIRPAVAVPPADEGKVAEILRRFASWKFAPKTDIKAQPKVVRPEPPMKKAAGRKRQPRSNKSGLLAPFAPRVT